MEDQVTRDAADQSPGALASAALRRHAWAEAFEVLSAADAEGELSLGELELLAQAAWWTGRLPLAIEVRERAYGEAMRSGDKSAAVGAALSLGRDNLFRNDVAVATAWLRRADELLSNVPENAAHGALGVIRAFAAALAGDADRSLAEASRAFEIGTRIDDRELTAIAKSEKGYALVMKGELDAGLALIDEATVAAVGGELEASAAGGVCCTSIEACAALGDWARAASWTEAQDRWCRREGINGYPGMCRLFRSEIKQFRGSWLEAEAEARQASVELEGFMPAAAGSAFLRIGELRLLRGDAPGAEEALRRAHTLGSDPEPVLSLVRLAQGRPQSALNGIRRALAEPSRMLSWRATPGTPLHRLPLLRAFVEIAIAVGDSAAARAAASEMEAIAGQFDTPFAQAAAHTARGAVELVEQSSEAIDTLRRAVELWNALASPYETARARLLLAHGLENVGALDEAVFELHAARSAFERLGAASYLQRVEERLRALGSQAHDATTDGADRVLRTFIFTDIVDSTRLAELLGDEAWAKLVRWHDQIIRSVVAEHGGEEIKATGDGFFLAFTNTDAAIQAMMDVQRRLAAHRDAHGFAPAVRIGIHTAEATRTGLDYLGSGVNYAARIGGTAGGGEILTSQGTLAHARRAFRTQHTRTVQLKGISEPATVATVVWS